MDQIKLDLPSVKVIRCLPHHFGPDRGDPLPRALSAKILEFGTSKKTPPGALPFARRRRPRHPLRARRPFRAAVTRELDRTGESTILAVQDEGLSGQTYPEVMAVE